MSQTEAYLKQRRDQERGLRDALTKAKFLLKQALDHSGHTEDCVVSFASDCTCWRAQAIQLLGKSAP